MTNDSPEQLEPEQGAPLCNQCDGGAMTLVRSSPGVATLPELRTYRCNQCGYVETIEA